MPKVSIVIPTYNVESYLRECLDSVVNQTLKDIEIICVNDGSTDNSLQIIQEYAAKDDRIKVIDKPNSGYGHSMNIGLDNATGEYFGIVEPDDYVELNMYETLYNKAKELDLDFIKSDFCRFVGDSENRKFTYNRLDRTGNYYNKIINIQDDLKPFKFIMNTWCGIYNLSFLRKYNIRHNETPGASFQDNGFWFQTFMNSTKAYFLDKPFYMNRRDNPNSSVKNKAKVYCMCEEYDYIRNIIDKNSNFEKFIPIYQYKRYCNYLFTLNRIDKKFKKEFIKKFSKDFKLAMQNNEIDKSLFGDKEYQNLELIINKPDKFYRKHLQKLSLFEKMLSVKNRDIHKIITFFGVKIKIKNSKLIEKNYHILQEIAEKQKEKIAQLTKALSIRSQNDLEFRTFQQLTSTIRKNLYKLPSDIDIVIGIPRSGIIPAYIIALFLNKNVCSINEFVNNLMPQKGERAINENPQKEKKKILIVDDSINTGKALSKVKEQLNSIDQSKYDIEYCCIYAIEESKNKVDYYFEIVEQPRMFQWNYLNHGNASISCYDMDGVLCVDPTDEENDDGEKYINFILNAKPLYIPTYTINSIVTSRLEKYRAQTEEWLRQHNVKYKNLYMLDLPSAEERRRLNCHADFKAKVFSSLENCKYFIESNRNQAIKIAELTGKQCICVETDEYFGG